jgi:DNA helicase-4
MYLSQTFRSNQGIADVATQFISRLDNYFDKKVTSVDRTTEEVVLAYLYDDPQNAVKELERALEKFAEHARQNGRRGTVFILSRYRLLFEHLPQFTQFKSDLSIQLKTIHASKGLQADYVAVMGLVENGIYSFPSEIANDPLLRLVMPDPEVDRIAEERRLMYVALTRARHLVALIGREYQGSRFLLEIIDDQALQPMLKINLPSSEQQSGNGRDRSKCPKCRKGTLHQRTGYRGVFYGCSRYPTCDHTQSVSQEQSTRSRT